MLDFPSSPQVDDRFPDPPIAGVPVWTWDGETWRRGGGAGGPAFEPDTTGSGDVFVLQQAPTINQPRIIGVTDNSNAAPGEVGEYIESGVPVGTQITSFSLLATLTLSRGDWDVWGRVNVIGAQGGARAFTSVTIYFDFEFNPSTPNFRSNDIGLTWLTVPISPQRVLVGFDGQTVSLYASATYPTFIPSTDAGSFIAARRVR